MAVGQTDIEAGRAFIPLRLVSEDWGQSIAKFGRRLMRASQRLRTAAMSMGVAAIMMATPFVAGAKVFADFSKQMAFVATMLDEPQEHIGAFTKGIRELSVEFGEATRTLSRGLYDILSAGFAPAQAMEMLSITTRAAKAGMADAAQATKAIIAVLNSYSLSAEHAEYVADNLFTTVRYGVTTFAELAGHIGLVAASAAQMGVSIEELGTALAVITRGGIETSAAVIALQNVLKTFSTPTGAGADFAKQLKEAGVGIDMTIQGLRNLGFLGIFKEIGKLPTEAIMRLFPAIRGQRGAMAMKAGIASIDKILQAHLKSTGMMDEAFQKVNKSFGFMVDRVKQAGVLILSYLGEAIAGSLANVGERVIDIAKGFGALIQRNKALIVWTVKLIATLAGLAVTFLVLAKAAAIVAGLLIIMAGPYAWASMIAGAAAAAVMWGLVAKAISEVKDALKDMESLGRQGTLGGKAETTGTAMAEYLAGKKNLEEQIKLHIRLTNRLNEAKRKAELLIAPGRSEERRAFYQRRSDLGQSMHSIEREYKLRQAIIQEMEFMQRAGLGRIDKLTKEQKILKGVAEEEKRRLDTMKQQVTTLEKIMGISTRGSFLGYWHTPTLAYASSYKTGEGDELGLLKDIKQNTADTVAAIEGKKPPIYAGGSTGSF